MNFDDPPMNHSNSITMDTNAKTEPSHCGPGCISLPRVPEAIIMLKNHHFFTFVS